MSKRGSTNPGSKAKRRKSNEETDSVISLSKMCSFSFFLLNIDQLNNGVPSIKKIILFYK